MDGSGDSLEELLVSRAQAGDADAFCALVTRHQRFVYNLALRVLSDSQEAEDLTQEAFLRAWTALANFRGQCRFSTWLYRIVTNLCYNRLPGLRRQLSDLGDDCLAQVPDEASYFGDPSRRLESNEQRARLHAAIEALPESYRLLVVLRYQQELSYDEIAGVLNLPLGTVKTGLFRARERLRESLDVRKEAVLCV